MVLNAADFAAHAAVLLEPGTSTSSPALLGRRPRCYYFHGRQLSV
jgi:hypothetical protein